jgi:hypothetical protein
MWATLHPPHYLSEHPLKKICEILVVEGSMSVFFFFITSQLMFLFLSGEIWPNFDLESTPFIISMPKNYGRNKGKIT